MFVRNNKIRLCLISCLAAGILSAVALHGLSAVPGRNASGYIQETIEKKTVAVQKTPRGIISYEGKDYKYNDHLSNYLFLGIDTHDTAEDVRNVGQAGQADAIFVVSYDRQTESARLLIIPRDTLAEIEIHNPRGEVIGKTIDHINLQYGYGDGGRESCLLMEDAVSALLGGIPFQGYCALKMDGIPLLADMIGGVEVVVPDDSLEEKYPEFAKGATVLLTKDNVEHFLRSRDTKISQSALARQGRHRVFIEAFVKKAKVMAEKESGFVARFYDGVKPYMVTSMSNDLFAKLLTANAQGMDTLPGEGAVGILYDEYHVNEDELQKLIMDMFYKEA